VASAAAEDLHFPPDRPADLLHVRLEARVDLEKKTLAGRARLDFAALQPLPSLRLDAHGLAISGVTVGGAPAPFSADGDALEIRMPEPLPRGARVQVTVDYACHDPEAGLYFFGPTPAAPDTPFQVWSQGETDECRSWIPILDNPDERTTSELVITVKKGLEVLSNGRLVGRTENNDGTETWHWSEEKSHVPYLITLVVGDFAVVREEWRGIPVEYWVPPAREGDVPRSFAATPRMLDFFSDRIGVPYPWEKYAQVVVEQFRFGGMENTSATTLTERTLHDQRAALDYSSEGLVAHELAHQWFGDLLTCREWAHTWLNEGFASYFEALWEENARGPDAFARNMWEKMGDALGAKPRPIVDRAYKNTWDQFDARAYPKGAWVLHMIRRRLGDDMWWRAVNQYVERYQHRGVETADWRRAIEEATGESFGEFFHDWTERPGHPVVTVSHGWNEGERLAEVRVRQTQKEDAFHFPLRIEYRFAGGKEPVTMTHRVGAKDERFYVALPERPALIRVDPDYAVLMQLTEEKGRDQWLRQLTEDPSVFLRLRAARHFGESRRDEDRKALADALGREPFWGVQAEICEALGKSGGDASRDVLLQALSLEHAKARRAAVKALGTFKGDETARGALEGIVTNGDASYYVEAEAIGAWAQQRPPGGVARLKPLLDRDSHNEVIREAVLKGLGQQADAEAAPLLIAWTGPGRPHACRHAALEGLGTLAQAAVLSDAQTVAVVEAVNACLGPREHGRIKKRAMETLRLLGEQASPALSALEALEAHDADPDVRQKAKEAIERIRSGAPPQVQLQQLRDELGKLREENEKMRERIERLDAKTGAK